MNRAQIDQYRGMIASGGPESGWSNESMHTLLSEIESLSSRLSKAEEERDEAQRAKYGTPCRCESWIETCRIAEEERDAARAEVERLKAALDGRHNENDLLRKMLSSSQAEVERLRVTIRDASHHRETLYTALGHPWDGDEELEPPFVMILDTAKRLRAIEETAKWYEEHPQDVMALFEEHSGFELLHNILAGKWQFVATARRPGEGPRGNKT